MEILIRVRLQGPLKTQANALNQLQIPPPPHLDVAAERVLPPPRARGHVAPPAAEEGLQRLRVAVRRVGREQLLRLDEARGRVCQRVRAGALFERGGGRGDGEALGGEHDRGGHGDAPDLEAQLAHRDAVQRRAVFLRGQALRDALRGVAREGGECGRRCARGRDGGVHGGEGRGVAGRRRRVCLRLLHVFLLRLGDVPDDDVALHPRSASDTPDEGEARTHLLSHATMPMRISYVANIGISRMNLKCVAVRDRTR